MCVAIVCSAFSTSHAPGHVPSLHPGVHPRLPLPGQYQPCPSGSAVLGGECGLHKHRGRSVLQDKGT